MFARLKKYSLTWWVVSLALHAAVVGAIAGSPKLQAWLNPFERSTPQIDPAPERVEAMIELTRQRMVQRLDQSLGSMRMGLAWMEETEEQHRGRVAARQPEVLDLSIASLREIQDRPPAVGSGAVENGIEEDDPQREAPRLEPGSTEQRLVQLYEELLDHERKINQAYERLKISALAARRGVNLSTIWESNRLIFPEREKLDYETMTMPIDRLDDGRFDRFRDETARLRRQILTVGERMSNLTRLARELATRDDDFELFGWHPEESGLTPVGRALATEEVQAGGDIDLDWIRDSPGDAYVPSGLVRQGTRLGHPDDAESVEWMIVDAWYVVGPFEHPGRSRQDLDRPYAPESIIDLDQEFIGKDGQTVRWRFTQLGRHNQRPQMMVTPPGRIESWAVWYAYTEIYSPTDQTVLMAFGSDDYGICWVNDQVVWKSNVAVRAWTPFGPDAFASVNLHRGINRVLFKLENAGGLTGFSMLIYTRPVGRP
ncbi:MAG: hypothetical protein JJU36_17060 [Phycisphaeraceae bacterium]|nr:hypothetical protein [Phycisphaeraceae bacterium]